MPQRTSGIMRYPASARRLLGSEARRQDDDQSTRPAPDALAPADLRDRVRGGHAGRQAVRRGADRVDHFERHRRHARQRGRHSRGPRPAAARNRVGVHAALHAGIFPPSVQCAPARPVRDQLFRRRRSPGDPADLSQPARCRHPVAARHSGAASASRLSCLQAGLLPARGGQPGQGRSRRAGRRSSCSSRLCCRSPSSWARCST